MNASRPSTRRAALVMHALRDEDRAWILAQLAAHEREPLAAMLDELRALGIPAEPDLVHQAMEPPESAVPAGDASDGAGMDRRDDPTAIDSSSAPDGAKAVLRRADAALVAEALRAEPAALVAALLAADAWPWRDAMLGQIGAIRRRQVEDLLADRRASAPRLHSELIGILAERLRDARSAASQKGGA